MKEIQPKRLAILILLLMCSLILSCNTDTTNSYDGKEEPSLSELVENEIKNGVRNDSIIIGLRLGMTMPQVDSVFAKALKDSIIEKKGGKYQYTITNFETSTGKSEKYTSSISVIRDGSPSKLIEVDLSFYGFYEGDPDDLMFLFNRKYGEAKFHSKEIGIEKNIYLSKGKAIKATAINYAGIQKFDVNYRDVLLLKQELEETKKQEALKMEKLLQEKERKEKQGTAGTKSI